MTENSEKVFNFKDPDEKIGFLQALDSFFQYSKIAHHEITHVRRQSFYALPKQHFELLAAPPFLYQETLNSVDDAIDENSKLSLAIFQAGLQSFDIETSTPESWQGKATSNDIEKARSTLRQFFRDWSNEGTAEREASYGRVVEILQAEKSSRPNGKLRVLVPGAGLGRLAFELCRAGIDAEGNEISYHQLLASFYILNICPKAHEHTLFPWVHSFSNHKTRSNQLKSVKIPDLHPGTTLSSMKIVGNMSMSASDFLLLYGNEQQKESFDAVASVFFLDTARNVVRYIETIKNCLRIGGLLVNLGPLLWHFENTPLETSETEQDNHEDHGIAEPGAVELTDDEVVTLVEKFGFRIESRESAIAAPYIHDADSMLKNIYKASFWCARKL
ncbi:Carnosine N-methyltransferase [Erysiphe necator]|uniref:carnosine N-methyltransferase n=1 Tax=Uncinula necator TaxID=52586 RepID=A0A0B1PCE7_UNCNE|nr:Carnosine N-methyltransferase [Erysiphe necator]KHJ36342.1 putative methyltransferase family [Erysiphe necator]